MQPKFALMGANMTNTLAPPAPGAEIAFNPAPLAPTTEITLTGTFKSCPNKYARMRIKLAINKSKSQAIGLPVYNNKGIATNYTTKMLNSDIDRGWLKWKVRPTTSGGGGGWGRGVCSASDREPGWEWDGGVAQGGTRVAQQRHTTTH